MVNMNDMMRVLLENEEGREISILLDDIIAEIVDKTKKINDCIIYDKEGTLEEEKINFSRVLQFVGDWTGYEVSCNELSFGKKVIPPSQFTGFARGLSEMLSQRYEGREMVIYISLCEKEIDLRFHTYREAEGLWLDEDLNKYDNPILCWK